MEAHCVPIFCDVDSGVWDGAQQRRADSFHFKNLRRIFRKKSSYYHGVIAPFEAPCSNEYLTTLANRFSVVPTPSQQFSFNRLKLLGHSLRHPDNIENTSTFMSSKAYRFLRGGNRSGRPTPHWAEVSMAEAYFRLQCDSGEGPEITNIHHDYWKSLSARDVRQCHFADRLPMMDNTRLYHRINPIAQDRISWQTLLTRPPKKTFRSKLLRFDGRSCLTQRLAQRKINQVNQLFGVLFVCC